MENYITQIKSLIQVSENLERNDFLNTIEDKIVSLYNTDKFEISPASESDKLRILRGMYILVSEQNLTLEELTKYLLIFPKSDLISFLYLILKNAETNHDH